MSLNINMQHGMLTNGVGSQLFQFMYYYWLSQQYNTLIQTVYDIDTQPFSIFNSIENKNLTNNIFINIPTDIYSFKYSHMYQPELKLLLYSQMTVQISKMIEVYKDLQQSSLIIHTTFNRTDYVNIPYVTIIQRKIVICVHIRTPKKRKNNKHIANIEWYIKAIQHLITVLQVKDENILLFIFCDDPIYVMNIPVFMYYNWAYLLIEVLHLSIENTFLLMSLCEHFIISNSYFSLQSYFYRKNRDSHIIIPATGWSIDMTTINEQMYIHIL